MKWHALAWCILGLIVGASAGWWLRGYSDIDACLDAGGRWQYGGGYCEGVSA